jgi:hypothetical protein
MANNARDLGLDYEPAAQERNFCERCGKRLGGDGHIHTCTPPAAQPAPVQEKNQSPYPEYDRGFSNGWDRGFAAAQPAPVQLTGEQIEHLWETRVSQPCPSYPLEKSDWVQFARAIEAAHGITTPPAQPAVQEGRDWSLLEATQESLREHMAEIKRLKAAQPAPVQHDECVVCGDKVRVIPRPWVGLSEEEVEAYDSWADFQVGCGRQTLLDMVRDIEAKLKEKNHG